MYDMYCGQSDNQVTETNPDNSTEEKNDTIAEDETTTEMTSEMTTEATTQAATESTTETTTEAEKKEYMLENSSTEYITASDLTGFTEEQCRIARNEIYARHGRMFDDDELQAYFYSCSWYVGRIAPSEFDESVLSSVERANLDVIIAYEKDMGYR
ncbi:MAG: YARHG domain-containing protein [Lachnospiraceae bacterium]|nr:YARHG domain-containing protein [Lachnospiraceae bacterium]